MLLVLNGKKIMFQPSLGSARAYKDTVRRIRVEVINQRRVLPRTNNSIQLSLIMRECTLVCMLISHFVFTRLYNLYSFYIRCFKPEPVDWFCTA